MRKWVSGLCKVCGLKKTKEENEMYIRPVDENSEPPLSPQIVGLESGNSSPTLSSVSSGGAYIPISECFTGKPIVMNGKGSGDHEVPYCNTTLFPFPPKVNWATHPVKKAVPQTPKENSLPPPGFVPIAPPRPPKTLERSVNGTAVTSAPYTGNENGRIKSYGRPIVSRSEALEDNQDSSSTSSSLQSPPGSASTLYCNLPDAPPPVQMKAQSNNHSLDSRYPRRQRGSHSSSTLPASTRRRVGPMISPNDRKPVILHEYEPPPELLGTYTQIDCNALAESSSALELKPHSHSRSTLNKKAGQSDVSASVEYRLIDHVKTKALNVMRQEREEQLRSTPVNKASN